MIQDNNRSTQKVLYRQSDYPVLQNRVYTTAEEAIACTKGDIEIVENQLTGLIYNDVFRPELMTYDATYNNEQGVSRQFRSHLESVAELIQSTLGKEELIEVGCGKGFFLEMLLKRGVSLTGFDSTYDGDNPRVIKKNFEPGIIEKPAHGLVLRHVLEHVQNPADFLFQLKEANENKGLIYIEVPCFDWICEKRAWFDIFYEHVNYFRLSDFKRMFGRVVKSGKLFGDQYIYVIADLESLRQPEFDKKDAVSFPSDFLRGLNFLDRPNQPRRPRVCVWGGASKGVIFSLLRERACLPVDVVIDVNPAKQGKHLPGTGILVQSPEMVLPKLPAETLIYVMNSNYLEEIKDMSKHSFRYIGIDQ